MLAIGLTFAITNLMASGLIFGAGRSEDQTQRADLSAKLTEARAPVFQTLQGKQVETQYPPEELEKLRSKLIELADVVKEYSDLLLSDNLELAGKLAAARKQFEDYSPQQLNSFRAIMNPAEMNGRMEEARAALEQYRPALESIRQERLQESRVQQQSKLQQSSDMLQVASATLPGREAPDAVCNALIGAGRVTSAMTIAADAVFLVAAGVRAGLSRGCNQVVVAVGAGGNTSSACIPADVVFFAAQAVRDKLKACDDDYTGRTVDAAFSRLEHLHNDLDTSIANDNTNKAAITGNANTNKTSIINNDNANASLITTNDNANKTSIVSNDNANKTSIVNNDNANKTTILNAIAASQAAVNANTNAGKDELRDLIRRTQIEANLAEEGGKGFVGLYVMPSANGGLLELVRAIVVDTIAKLGGKHTANANKDLARGDAQKALGNFSKAYDYYRKAYRTAVKED